MTLKNICLNSGGSYIGTHTMAWRYNPIIHRGKSMWLKEIGYSNHGLYFITICWRYKIGRWGKVMPDLESLNKFLFFYSPKSLR